MPTQGAAPRGRCHVMAKLPSVFLVALALSAHPALALDFKALNVGVQGSLVAPPYPTFGGVSAQVTFFDFLRIQGDFGAGQYILGRMAGVNTASWGGTALVRIPALPISPIAGLSLSKNYNDESGSIFHSKNTLGTTRASYLTPMAGVEIRPGHFYFGFGLCAPFRKTDGTWKRQSYDAENTLSGSITRFTVLPFGYVGFQLF